MIYYIHSKEKLVSKEKFLFYLDRSISTAISADRGPSFYGRSEPREPVKKRRKGVERRWPTGATLLIPRAHQR